MKNITSITNLLIAMKYLCQQGHLTSTSYSDHLLFEKIEDDLDNEIDLLKETSIFTFGTTIIASCADALKESSNYIQAVEKDASTEQCLSYILEIINKIITETEIFNTENEKETLLKSIVEDTCKELMRKGYLIEQRLKK